MTRFAIYLFTALLFVGCIGCKAKKPVAASTQAVPPPPPEPVSDPIPEPEEEEAAPFVEGISVSEGFNKDQIGAHVNIVSHSLEDRYLTLNITYSGGCQTHAFRLATDLSYLTNQPPSATLYLVHQDNGDNCEALLSETLMFDISSVRNPESDRMLITVFGYDQTIEYIY
ncbi:MAG: NigD-like C-terminal domain-containing protein [Salibacteraceae bacterium]